MQMIGTGEPKERFAVVFKTHQEQVNLAKIVFFSEVWSYFQSCHAVYRAIFISGLLFKMILLPENKEQIFALLIHNLHKKEY